MRPQHIRRRLILGIVQVEAEGEGGWGESKAQFRQLLLGRIHHMLHILCLILHKCLVGNGLKTAQAESEKTHKMPSKLAKILQHRPNTYLCITGAALTLPTSSLLVLPAHYLAHTLEFLLRKIRHKIDSGDEQGQEGEEGEEAGAVEEEPLPPLSL